MRQCLQKIVSRLATKVTYHTVTSLATPQRPRHGRKTAHMRQSKAVSASRKPVIVRKFSRDWCAGYADTSFSEEAPDLELLDLSGKLSRIDWVSIKWVCYVREFVATANSGADADSPERLLRRRFPSRPRMTGLWLRLLLKDGDGMEGIAANDRSLLNPSGLLLTPPDTRSNTQRIFIPRTAIRDLTVLAVIASTSRSAPAEKNRTESQPDLFAAANLLDSEKTHDPVLES